VTDLVQQRSMLVILLAACTAAQTAFEAADNSIDTELRDDLDKMIVRTEAELAKLNRLIDDAAA
jgi:hypothetical protein